MSDVITTFKIRIDSIEEFAIGFELFSGERVDDTYVNVIRKGAYGVNNRLVLTPKQFKDFCNRLIAYVYTEKKDIKDNELLTLWDLRVIIYDDSSQVLGSSIFRKRAEKLEELSENRKRELEERKEKRI